MGGEWGRAVTTLLYDPTPRRAAGPDGHVHQTGSKTVRISFALLPRNQKGPQSGNCPQLRLLSPADTERDPAGLLAFLCPPFL